MWTILLSEVVKSDDRIKLFVHHPCWLNIYFFILSFWHFAWWIWNAPSWSTYFDAINNVSGNPLIYMVVHSYLESLPLGEILPRFLMKFTYLANALFDKLCLMVVSILISWPAQRQRMFISWESCWRNTRRSSRRERLEWAALGWPIEAAYRGRRVDRGCWRGGC